MAGPVMLPRRRKPPKLGLRVPPQRVWPRHRRWVKSHGCCVPGCTVTIVDFAHLRSESHAGKGLKPHDAFGVSLCRTHHIEQHSLGEETFERRYGIVLQALAAEFVRRSPDLAMRASLDLDIRRTLNPETLWVRSNGWEPRRQVRFRE
jgi:hypothetical protein